VKGLANEMLNDKVKGFNHYWGSGIDGTVFDENDTLGRGKRQKGLPKETLCAAAVDPRMKKLKGLGPLDRAKVWTEVASRMRIIGQENADKMVHVVKQVVAKRVRYDALRIFDDMNDSDTDDEEIANVAVPVEGPGVDNVLERAIEIEITLYKGLPKVEMFEGGVENCTVNCPLVWWKVHQHQLPLMSQLARRLLCIPATSAPSERVFSVAGLTISKKRNKLTPQHANELIFLHNSWDVAIDFEAKQKA
jgi:hypothetical protein